MRYRHPIFGSIKDIDDFAAGLCDENDELLEQRAIFLDCLLEIYKREGGGDISNNMSDLIRTTIEVVMRKPLEKVKEERKFSRKLSIEMK